MAGDRIVAAWLCGIMPNLRFRAATVSGEEAQVHDPGSHDARQNQFAFEFVRAVRL